MLHPIKSHYIGLFTKEFIDSSTSSELLNIITTNTEASFVEITTSGQGSTSIETSFTKVYDSPTTTIDADINTEVAVQVFIVDSNIITTSKIAMSSAITNRWHSGKLPKNITHLEVLTAGAKAEDITNTNTSSTRQIYSYQQRGYLDAGNTLDAPSPITSEMLPTIQKIMSVQDLSLIHI